MALNPQLFPGSELPVPFLGETFVLGRDGLELSLDGLPGGTVSVKGSAYLSSIRIVFVAAKPTGQFSAFDIPLAYVTNESFNQPIFGCNNLSGKVYPVVADASEWGQRPPHNWKLYFKEGGCGTFIPLFFNILRGLRAQMPPPQAMPAGQTVPLEQVPPPIPTSQPPVEEFVRKAYVDPNDPSRLFLHQPFAPDEGLRREDYNHQGGSAK